MSPVCGVLVILIANGAPAQPPADDAAVVRAREAYTEGLVLFKRGRYTDAASKFEEANALSPRPGNLFNLGRCYERLKVVPGALKAYREYLRTSPEGKEGPEVRAAVAKLEAQLRLRGVQQIAVRAEPEGKALVRIDGRDWGLAPIVAELAKGSHVFEVSADGYAPQTRAYTVELEHAADLSFALERAPSSVSQSPSERLTPSSTINGSTSQLTSGLAGVTVQPVQPRRYLWAWVSTALTVAALAVGSGFGIAELGKEGELRAKVTPRPRADNLTLADQARGFALGANVGFASGGALAIASVLLFIFEGGSR